MRAYADSSFLVRLFLHEPGSEEAFELVRRADFPDLPFLPIHRLEVTNAIRQRAFHRKGTLPSRMKLEIERERDAAFGRLEKWLSRRWLTDASIDLDTPLSAAIELSKKHTEKLGCRGFDLLHVALALELRSEQFLTADRVQGKLAKAAGLKTFTLDRE